MFGMQLNVEKTELGPLVSFLGYKMDVNGVPLANYDKLVAQLLFPSVRDRDIYDFASRARALQLSCFGKGCWSFTLEVQSFLDDMHDFHPYLHSRDELTVKLEALDLAHWPPLYNVIQLSLIHI